MFIGAAFMFVIVKACGHISIPDRSDWSMVLSVGLLQMAIPTALMHFSLSFVDAGRASLLAFTHPIWVAPLAVLFLGERLNTGRVGGLIVGMTGLCILFNPLAFDWSQRTVLIGNGCLILSAISWAVGIVHVRAHKWTGSPLSLSPWQMLVAGCILLSLSLTREDVSQTIWDTNLVYVLVFVGFVATAFAYWGAVTVSRHLPAMVSSLGFLGVPIVGIGSSALILMEPLTLIRSMLGGINPKVFYPLFAQELQSRECLGEFHCLDGRLLVAMDGTPNTSHRTQFTARRVST